MSTESTDTYDTISAYDSESDDGTISGAESESDDGTNLGTNSTDDISASDTNTSSSASDFESESDDDASTDPTSSDCDNFNDVRSLVKPHHVKQRAKYFKTHELGGHTFCNHNDLPAILFPSESISFFDFDQASFASPLSNYRSSNFELAVRLIPGFLKGYFDERDSKILFTLKKLLGATMKGNPAPNRVGPIVSAPCAMTNVGNDFRFDNFKSKDDETPDYEDGVVTEESQVVAWFLIIILCCQPLITKRDLPSRTFLANFYAEPRTHIKSGSGRRRPIVRKPVIALVNRYHRRMPEDGEWAMICTVCDVTRTPGFPGHQRRVVAERAALLLQNCPGRRFVPILMISDRQFALAIFHRSGVTCSQKYDIVDEEHRFIRIIVGLAYAEPQYLGYDTDITLDAKTGRPVCVNFDYRIYNIKEEPAPLVDEYIVGRGSVSFTVEDSITKEIFTLKLVWEDDTGKELPETQLYKEFAKFGIKGVPILIKSMNGVYQEPNQQDSTSIWKPWGAKNFRARTYRKYLLAGAGVPLSNFRTKRELLGALEDLVTTLQALSEAGYLHRNVILRNIRLAEQYPEYSPEMLENFLSEQYSALPDSNPATSPSELHPVQQPKPEESVSTANNDDRYRALLFGFEYARRTSTDAKDRAEEPTDYQETVFRVCTSKGALVSASIQVLLGYPKPDDKVIHHTLQMDFESLFYNFLYIAINRAGPSGTDRDFTLEDPPRVYGGHTDNPTKAWCYPDRTPVDLGIYKGSTYSHLKGYILPWIHPYFEDMGPFFVDFAEALFPSPIDLSDPLSLEHRDMHVCSEVKAEKIIEIIRKYKGLVQEPHEKF